MKLSQISVESLKGVGVKIAEKLAALSIYNLEELLFHLPSKYQDRSRIHPIGSLRHGQVAQVCGIIEGADIVFGKRRSLICKMSDSTGILDIRLFYFSMAQKKQFVRGDYVQIYGTVSHGGRSLSMIHPEIKFLHSNSKPILSEGLQAVYPTTQGLQQRTFQSLVKQALEHLTSSNVKELLPHSMLTEMDFPPLADALKLLHNPPLNISLKDLQSGEHPLVQRLAFEELVAQQLALKKIKSHHQSFNSFAITINQKLQQRFLRKLPFTLTSAQLRVIKEILADVIIPRPMMRLVQGDVGCGKTLVAAFVMLQFADNQKQSVLMAPTELLAEQHYTAFLQWFTPLNIGVVLLTGRMSTKQKRQALDSIQSGDALIIIGTHAVFQQQVVFDDLSLVVIDEQHRFGVEQRKQLLEKGSNENNNASLPHQLIMSATPIPRTLAQTTFADLDLSVIDELPPGRKPIETTVISDLNRQRIFDRVEQACRADKRQVYWVCTLIEESEDIPSQAAEATYEKLVEQFTSLRIGLVHGRLNAKQKHQVMADFKSGKLDVLVATTVIEVGVDVPNASLMIIENPERLGLSQLHQLRGRVGRGDKKSYCLLMYTAPLSQNAKQRLNVMRETNDGFKIAQKDLEIRGAGEVLGTRQTGDMIYRFADLIRDQHLLAQVQKYTDIIIREHPELCQPLCERWVQQDEQLSRV